MSLSTRSTSAVILAGGQGRRFGSYKPEFSVFGRTLLQYLVNGIQDVYDEILVVVGTEQQKEQVQAHLGGLVILVDRVQSIGPLAGIMTGASFARNEYCQILPVDSPLSNREVLRELASHATGHDATVPKWPDGRIEPLHSVYRAKAAAREAELLIGHGDYSVISLINALPNIRYIRVDQLRQLDPDLDTFANANTRGDIDKIASKLGRAR